MLVFGFECKYPPNTLKNYLLLISKRIIITNFPTTVFSYFKENLLHFVFVK